MKMKKFAVRYSLYDLDLGTIMNCESLFDNLEELSKWMHNQPDSVYNLVITDIYEIKKVNYVPYKGKGS